MTTLAQTKRLCKRAYHSKPMAVLLTIFLPWARIHQLASELHEVYTYPGEHFIAEAGEVVPV